MTFRVLEEVGGWNKVLDRFKSDHIKKMDLYPHRFMVLLIDFDGESSRLEHVKAAVPGQLGGRVFVLGTWTEPEDLRRAKLGSYENIGKKMARDCREECRDVDTIWDHDLLRHNASEIDRLREHVRPILFESK